MKKNITIGAAIIFFIITASSAKAQFFQDNVQIKKISCNNMPALFAASHKAGSNTKWYESSWGFVARFSSNNISYRIDLNKHGHWLKSILTYDASHLPSGIHQKVIADYKNYVITLVQEIQMPDRSKIYIIHIESKSDLINLRVCDNVMDEWQKIIKSQSTRFTSKSSE